MMVYKSTLVLACWRREKWVLLISTWVAQSLQKANAAAVAASTVAAADAAK